MKMIGNVISKSINDQSIATTFFAHWIFDFVRSQHLAINHEVSRRENQSNVPAVDAKQHKCKMQEVHSSGG